MTKQSTHETEATDRLSSEGRRRVENALERLTLANMAIWAEDVDFRALAAAEVYRRHVIQNGWVGGRLQYHDPGDWADRRREEKLCNGQPIARAWRQEATKGLPQEAAEN
jgi:hypothetical protein